VGKSYLDSLKRRGKKRDNYSKRLVLCTFKMPREDDGYGSWKNRTGKKSRGGKGNGPAKGISLANDRRLSKEERGPRRPGRKHDGTVRLTSKESGAPVIKREAYKARLHDLIPKSG